MSKVLVEWIRAHRLATLALVSGALGVWLHYWAPGITWVVLAGVLGGSIHLITRRATGETAMVRLLDLSFGIRCVMAGILFAISSLDLPVLQSLHRDNGLWAFGADGVLFHAFAVKILDAWRLGIDLPSVFIEGGLSYHIFKSLSLPIAMVYAVTGTSPLHFILINAWLGAMSGLLAYLLAARLGNRRSALTAAGLVAFWPSSMLWSTQLLKDPAVLALLLASLLLFTALWQHYSSTDRTHRRHVLADIARWSGLAAAVFGVTYFRSHLGGFFAFSMAVVLAPAAARALLSRRWKECLLAVGMMTFVGTATVIGMSVDLTSLLSPSHPEVGYVRQAETFRDKGQIAAAIAAYRRAIEFNPAYAPAHRGLSLALIGYGDQEGAAAAFNAYLQLTRADNDNSRFVTETATTSPGTPGAAPTAAEITGAIPSSRPKTSVRLGIAEWARRMHDRVSSVSVTSVTRLRGAEVETGGASLIDDMTFAGLEDIVAYLPRALANAYFAPYPWQLWFTGGQTGAFRPLAAVEMALIAILVPSIVIGCWQRVRRFRPEEWVLIVFVGVVALAYGVILTNGGSLFRARLQFLFPALILASRVVQLFISRLFGAFASHVRTGSDDRSTVSAGV